MKTVYWVTNLIFEDQSLNAHAFFYLFLHVDFAA